MKVKELIERLKDLDPEAMVATRGYEGGYHEMGTIEDVILVLGVNTAWYYDPHERNESYRADEFEGKARAKAYLLGA